MNLTLGKKASKRISQKVELLLESLQDCLKRLPYTQFVYNFNGTHVRKTKIQKENHTWIELKIWWATQLCLLSELLINKYFSWSDQFSAIAENFSGHAFLFSQQHLFWRFDILYSLKLYHRQWEQKEGGSAQFVTGNTVCGFLLPVSVRVWRDEGLPTHSVGFSPSGVEKRLFNFWWKPISFCKSCLQ